jgi:hypothetical protein
MPMRIGNFRHMHRLRLGGAGAGPNEQQSRVLVCERQYRVRACESVRTMPKAFQSPAPYTAHRPDLPTARSSQLAAFECTERTW